MNAWLLALVPHQVLCDNGNAEVMGDREGVTGIPVRFDPELHFLWIRGRIARIHFLLADAGVGDHGREDRIEGHQVGVQAGP